MEIPWKAEQALITESESPSVIPRQQNSTRKNKQTWTSLEMNINEPLKKDLEGIWEGSVSCHIIFTKIRIEGRLFM